jgi:hypothetical protein
VTGEDAPAPPMLRQPADAPPPLAHLAGDVAAFRRVVAGRDDGRPRTLRAWAARLSGRSDRRFLQAQAEAMEAMAVQCDLLVDRLNLLEAKTADVAGAYGEEITRLRAEVLHLRRAVAAERDPGS